MRKMRLKTFTGIENLENKDNTTKQTLKMIKNRQIKCTIQHKKTTSESGFTQD